ncbi:hypothetical protein MalM25_22080 [Planctomycetes bacterium MalM25]|nr:hypothetical protein MalM25_22080 [Planctomycetes bacterium MalM25]
MKRLASLLTRCSRARRSDVTRKRNCLRLEPLEGRLLLASVTFNTPSTNGGDGTWDAEQRAGTPVVVGPAYLYYNLNPIVSLPGFTQGDSLYVKVDYFDEGSGTIKVQYDSLASNFDQTEYHSRSSRIDTQQFVSSHHYLTEAQFANGANGHDFRVIALGAPVASVTVSDEPFAGSGLEWAWSPPWEAPYTGPSRPVDASNLAGKVLTGYQGWFNTPNDAADEGYVHWGVPGDWSIEQWPDANDYDSTELFPVPGVTTASGDQAYLFSSANDSVVDRHFHWMREHDIDGVLLQRFRPSFMYKDGAGDYSGEPQWPVVNARDAAHRAGRTWAIEYDIQNGGSPSERDQVIQHVKDDWEYLTDPGGLDMLNDSHYQREGGKPVVAIFGLYVSSGNSYSTAQQQELISYFQSRGVYVVGAGRHSESPAQLANAALHDAYIPWQGYWKGGDTYAPDEATLDGVTTHIPHVFPGFSWTHLQNSSTATSRDREDGEFYWRMLDDAVNETDAPWLFLGMFDEYDEGTNLIPASDDPPVPDTDGQGNPLTYQVSDPRPNDWWMALTGAAKQALQDKASINGLIPSESDLENRSNVGGEARWNPDASDRLHSVPTSDSDVETVDVVVQGVSTTAIRSTDPYLYFSIDDSYLSADENGRDVTIEVEYLDLLVGQFDLEYDGLASPYSVGSAAPLTGSGEWRTHRFEVSDAHFGNRQNGDADFRLSVPGGNLFVRSASVLKESVLAVDADLGQVDTANGLENLEFSGDGQTEVVVGGGREARQLTGDPESHYLYLNIDDAFANEVHAGLNAIVEVTYQDVGTGSLRVQYDATGAAYKNSQSIQLTGSNEWRTGRIYLDDAFFGNRQNGGADLRLVGNNIPIDRVRVLKSFGDLMAPELNVGSPVVDSPGQLVNVAVAVSDDWQTGRFDQWTRQEDNQVLAEVSDDGGGTWQAIATFYETTSPNAVSTYDTASGVHNWSDDFRVSTSGFATGAYRMRLTPVDGRGNPGESIVTQEFTVHAPPALPGDYNLDGAVDAIDYTVWRDAQGTLGAPYGGADGDGNGSVGPEDYDVWRVQYGATASPSSSLATDLEAAGPRLIAEEELSLMALASVAPVSPPDRSTAVDLALASFSLASSDAEPVIPRTRVVLDPTPADRHLDLLLVERPSGAEPPQVPAVEEKDRAESISSSEETPSHHHSSRIEALITPI